MNNLQFERILEISNNPKNNFIPQKYTHSSSVKNIFCGDAGELYINLENGIIKDIGFKANGCALLLAGFSLLTEYLKNKKIEDIKLLTPAIVYELFQIPINPLRTSCAGLCYNALEEILKNVRN